MAGTSRTNTHVVEWLQRLQAEPHKFGFNATLRKLEAIYRDKPCLGESARANDDAVRLGQEPSLAFAPASLASFQAGAGNSPDRLDSFFFGIFGPNGPMPLHLTEYARSRELNESDSSFRRFSDIFHHRLLSLFYRAWANGEPTVNMDRPGENRFDLFIGAVLGIGAAAFRNRDDFPDAAKLHHAGRFSLRTRPAEGLCAVLEDYFQLPFSIRELTGEWLTIAKEDRLLLGRSRQAGTLGVTAILGAEVWNCQHKFRIVCGSLSLRQFQRLLPGAESVRVFVALVRNYVGDEFAWDLQLILKKEDVPGVVLGTKGQLGWTTWLGEWRQEYDANDVIIAPQLSVAV